MGHGEKEDNSDLYGITVFVPTSDLMFVFYTLVYTYGLISGHGKLHNLCPLQYVTITHSMSPVKK